LASIPAFALLPAFQFAEAMVAAASGRLGAIPRKRNPKGVCRVRFMQPADTL
jgi:hypothetical protein